MDGISCTTVGNWYGEKTRSFLSAYNAFLIWFGSFATPAQITIGRIIIAIPALYLWKSIGSQEAKITAIVIIVLSWYGDHLDGAVARITNQVTEWGKKFDPLFDKVLFYMTEAMFYDQVWIPAIIPMFILDIISTCARENKNQTENSANIFGKWKLVTQVGNNISFALAEVTGIHSLVLLANVLLVVAVILGFISVKLRLIPNWCVLPNFTKPRDEA